MGTTLQQGGRKPTRPGSHLVAMPPTVGRSAVGDPPLRHRRREIGNGRGRMVAATEAARGMASLEAVVTAGDASNRRMMLIGQRTVRACLARCALLGRLRQSHI